MYKIRAASKQDIKTIFFLCTKLWHEHKEVDPRFDLGKQFQKIHWKWLKTAAKNRNALILVAEKNNQIVGTGAAVIAENSSWHSGKYGYIRDVYILPDHRRQGLATAIVERLINWLNEQDIPKIELVALVANQEAIRFWSDKQFKPLYTIYQRQLDNQP